MKKFFLNVIKNFGSVIVAELRPRQLATTLFVSFLLMLAFVSLPIFAGRSAADGLMVKGFLYGLIGYFLMRIVAHKIRDYLMNRKEIKPEAEVAHSNKKR